MEPDLSHSISHHPHAFRTQSQSASSIHRHHHHHHQQHQMGGSGAAASSTGVEATDGDDHGVTRHRDVEVESQRTGRLPLVGVEHDPYGLSQRYKTPSELAAIKANTSRKRDAARPDSDSAGVASTGTGGASGSGSGSKGHGSGSKWRPSIGRSALQARRVRGFYEAQNETIERMLKTVEEHVAEARQEQGDDHLKYQIAVWGSLVANLILTVLQVYAAISSGSLSLFTTMADAIFDPLSNVTLIFSNRAVNRVDPNRFPSGKARLETVGNITFCFIMSAVSVVLIAFSAQELGQHHKGDGTKDFHLPSVIAVCVAFATKFSLFLYTWSLKDKYSQVRILWQDHRNDLLVNGFGILTSVGGAKLVWWLDPAGAILLSVIISVIWLRTAFTEFLLLVGVTASVEIQQLITYVCVTHSPLIKQIDTVRAYHSGPRLIAEVDVVMDPDASLRETHDVAEELQMKLESLPDVERAYVHVDYETTHKPEHAYKKDL
ncbi:cation efflux family-domain-containing protein [Neurospora tetraspora]|uniref:Cation efflux family-domain-containing protein n=1 Tax=Neurospora tetraspora TaxID=94610 RepID=A0AAE0JLB5_9PEZI|nr:cation efflux family-domain-containing protein [Neurospora tetraspora]